MKIVQLHPRFKNSRVQESKSTTPWPNIMGREPEIKRESHPLAVALADQMVNLFGQVESGLKIKYEDLVKVAGRLLSGNVKKDIPQAVVEAGIYMLGELEPEFGKYSVTWRVNFCIKKILIYGTFPATLGAAKARMEVGGTKDQEPAFHDVIWDLAKQDANA